MDMYVGNQTDIDVESFISHHGTRGMHWGERKYQNSDGSLTPLGRLHYGVGAARNAAGKAGSAIKKKINPSKQDLEDKYQKAVAKRDKKELKAAIKEVQGKKKKNKDLTDQEILDKYNRLQRQKAIEEMEKENSTAHKIGKGIKVAARGTAKGAEVTAKGAIWTAKMAGKVASPLLGLGGSLVMRGLRNAGENWVDNLTMSESARAKQNADMSKNLLDTAKNMADLKDVNSGAYESSKRLARRAEDAKNQANIADSKAKVAERTLSGAKAAVDLRQVRSGSYETAQFLKQQSENAKNQANIASELRKAYSAGDKPKKSIDDFVKEQERYRDSIRVGLETKTLLGDDVSYERLKKYTSVTKKK